MESIIDPAIQPIVLSMFMLSIIDPAIQPIVLSMFMLSNTYVSGNYEKDSLNMDGQQFQQYDKMNNHLLPQITEHKKSMIYDCIFDF
jgi:hypothetical protein